MVKETETITKLSLRKAIPLAEIPFPLGLEGTTGLPQSRRALKNCFNAGGPIIQRPGITLIGTTGGTARSRPFEWNGSLYAVVSTDLIKINVTTGATTFIGSIGGGEQIVTAAGFNEIVIISKGGNGYTLDKSDVLTIITSPQFVPCDSVTHINGRFVYIPSDGSPAFFSDVGFAGTIQTTSFFDAEELPDSNKATLNFRNILYILGTDSIESFRDFGNEVVPYRRLNARIDNGYHGGLLEYNNTFLFMGKEKDQDVGIYALGQGIAPKISNEYIDTILKTYAESELNDAISNRIKWRGFDIATFTLARHSFGFLGGNWFELDTVVGGVNGKWNGGYIGEHNLNYYSMFEGNIGRFDAINKDYGLPFQRLIDLGFESEQSFSAQRLEYRLSQGYNNIGSVTLETSENNVLYGPKLHRNTADIGYYTDKLEWNYPGGLGYYDGFMGIRLSTAEDIDFSASKLMLDIR